MTQQNFLSVPKSANYSEYGSNQSDGLCKVYSVFVGPDVDNMGKLMEWATILFNEPARWSEGFVVVPLYTLTFL